MLLSLLGLSLLSIFHVSFLTNEKNIKLYSFIYTGLIFIGSLFLWVNFDSLTTAYQFVADLPWIGFFNYTLYFGVDGISLFFIILSTLLIPLCILASWNTVKHQVKAYFLCFLVLDFLLIGVFSVIDVFLFYIFFETILIPMFLVIGVWGSRERKIRAVYLFFFYTLLGSVLM